MGSPKRYRPGQPEYLRLGSPERYHPGPPEHLHLESLEQHRLGSMQHHRPRYLNCQQFGVIEVSASSEVAEAPSHGAAAASSTRADATSSRDIIRSSSEIIRTSLYIKAAGGPSPRAVGALSTGADWASSPGSQGASIALSWRNHFGASITLSWRNHFLRPSKHCPLRSTTDPAYITRGRASCSWI